MNISDSEDVSDQDTDSNVVECEECFCVLCFNDVAIYVAKL